MLRERCCLLALSGLLLIAAGRSAECGVQMKAVKYTHEETPLQGYLCWDDSISGKRPGVLVVHEWWGLNEYAQRRARELAEMGYVAFALDMYGSGQVTQHPEEAGRWAGQVRSNAQRWRDRALKGLEVLKTQELADPDRLAAIGYCFGGSTVLQLAFADAPVKGVVSFHGALSPPPPDVPVRAKVLVCHGEADSFIPPAVVQAFEDGMDQAKADYTIIIYSGARHGFTNPDAGNYGVDALKYDATADRRSWGHMKLFFEEIFAPAKS
jgi:dienelactone hydrolase